MTDEDYGIIVVGTGLIDEEKFSERFSEKLYFSDLTEEQMLQLFDKGPLFRFELCNIFLQYGNFGKKLKLFGSIEIADLPVILGDISPDPALDNVGFLKVFNCEYDNPLPVPARYTTLNDHVRCSIPFSNYIQINAKLYIFTDKEDDVKTDDDFYNEMDKVKVSIEEDVVEKSDDDYNELEETKITNDMKEDAENDNSNGVRNILHYFDVYTDGTFILKSKEDAEKIDNYDVEFYEQLEKSDVNLYPEKIEKKDEVVNDNELFEICNEYVVMNFLDYLAKRPNGGGNSVVSKGKDGSLELCFVALKYAVEANVEVEFVVSTSKEIKVAGRVMAYYGKGFDYNCHPMYGHLYKPLLFETNPDDFVKPGKVNLMRSELSVPAQFSLIIDVDLCDPISLVSVLTGVYEFHVPCEGKSSVGSIEGVDLSLRLKVDWTVPHDVFSC